MTHRLVHSDNVKCNLSDPFHGIPFTTCTGKLRKNKRSCGYYVVPDSCSYELGGIRE